MIAAVLIVLGLMGYMERAAEPNCERGPLISTHVEYCKDIDAARENARRF